MAVSLEQFIEQLNDIELMSPKEVFALVEGLPDNRRPQDAEGLARELVAVGRLTPYQARVLAAGKGASIVLGVYLILEPIGEGRTNRIFKARHRVMKRTVALKLMPRELMNNPPALEEFRQILKSVGKLAHHHVVTIHDMGQERGIHYLVMQYIEGEDLHARVRGSGALAVDRAINYTVQAARGLEFIHRQQIVHGYVRPRNLLLDGEETIKILNVGLAWLDVFLEKVSDSQARLTSALIDARTDVFSLGCTLGQLLTGELTDDGSTVERLSAPVVSLCKAREDVPAELDSIYQKMVAKLPQDRYQSMSDVIVDLEKLCPADDLQRHQTTAGSAPDQWPSTSPQIAIATESSEAISEDTSNLDVAADTDPSVNESVPESPRRRKPLRVLAAVIALVLVVAGGGYLTTQITWNRPAPTPTPKDSGVNDSPDDKVITAISQRATLRGHTGDAIGRPAFMPDGKLLITPGADSTLRVWNAETGKPHHSLLGHRAPVVEVAMSPDGQTLASAGINGTVGLWDLKTKRLLGSMSAHDKGTHCVCLTPDGKTVASGGEDGTIKLWDVETRELQANWSGHVSPVRCLSFSPNGRWLASGSDDTTAIVWDVELGQPVTTLSDHKGGVLGVCFAPDGESLATSSLATISLWKTNSGEQINSLVAWDEGEVQQLQFASGGRLLAAAGPGNAVHLWDTTERRVVATIGTTGKAVGACFSADSRKLVVTSEHQEATLWDLTWDAKYPTDGDALVTTKPIPAIVSTPMERPVVKPVSLSIAPHASPRIEPGAPISAMAMTRQPPKLNQLRSWTIERVRHRGEVLDLAMSFDDRRLATAGADGTIRVWNMLDDTLSHFLVGHDARVVSLSWSPDNKYLASDDMTVCIWDVQSGRRLRSFLPSEHEMHHVAWSPQGTWLAFADNGGGLWLWDIQKDRQITARDFHTGAIQLAWSPTGRRLATGAEGGSIKIWDVEAFDTALDEMNPASLADDLTGHRIEAEGVVADVKPNKELIGGKRYIWSIVWSPDGHTLAAANKSEIVHLWDVESAAYLKTFATGIDQPRGLDLTWPPPGDTLRARRDNGEILHWDVASGRLQRTVKPSEPSSCLAWSHDGNWMITGVSEGGVLFSSPKTGRADRQLIEPLKGFALAMTPVGDLNIAPESQKHIMFAAITDDGSSHALSMRDFSDRYGWQSNAARMQPPQGAGSPPVKPPTPRGVVVGATLRKTVTAHVDTVKNVSHAIRSIAFSPPSAETPLLASGSRDETIKLWNPTTGSLVRTLTGHTSSVLFVAFSPAGDRLASASADGTIRFWEVETGKELQVLEGHLEDVICVQFSPDGKTLASASQDHTARLWDAETGRHRLTLIGHTSDLVAVAFSPDSKTLATSGYDNMIRIWDAETGRYHRSIVGHEKWTTTLAFSPDGTTLASGGDDNAVKFWEFASGDSLPTRAKHTSSVHHVAYSPDGNTIASAGLDDTVRLWSGRTGKLINVLTDHDTDVYSLAFSPDGTSLASSDRNGKINLWDLQFAP